MYQSLGCCIILLYPLYCYCLRMICEKAGHEPGCVIWVPIIQNIPLLRIAGLPVWMIVLFFVPVVNVAAEALLWINVCKARGKGALAMLAAILVPFAGIPYLAYSDSANAGPLVVHRRTDAQLILGPRRQDELVALFCFVFGIFWLSLWGMAFFHASDVEIDEGGLAWLTWFGAPLGIVGTVMLWFQDRLVFDRPAQRLVVLRALRKQLVFEFDEIGVEVTTAAGFNPGVGQCHIALPTMRPILVTAGPLLVCDTMAEELERFLGIEPRRTKVTGPEAPMPGPSALLAVTEAGDELRSRPEDGPA